MAEYKDKQYYVFACCEEDAYFKILQRAGARVSCETIDDVIESEKMEVFLV